MFREWRVRWARRRMIQKKIIRSTAELDTVVFVNGDMVEARIIEHCYIHDCTSILAGIILSPSILREATPKKSAPILEFDTAPEEGDSVVVSYGSWWPMHFSGGYVDGNLKLILTDPISGIEERGWLS